jgi:hypothetical protein
MIIWLQRKNILTTAVARFRSRSTQIFLRYRCGKLLAYRRPLCEINQARYRYAAVEYREKKTGAASILGRKNHTGIIRKNIL